MDTSAAQPVIEQFVIAFPTAAAWLIVLLLAMIIGIVLYLGRKFLHRMDTQDDALTEIKELIASEVGKLRELYHGVDRRVVGVEATLRFMGGKPMQRGSDEPKTGD
ncbi:MAG: hypothetical protein IT518_22265 [Burkholderiales bacterium]|nr:hypothetical protein [Burkholderiales bacterium]